MMQILCILLATAITFAHGLDTVQTSQGPIKGFSQGNGVDVFLGIPFSAPPVGELRWKPPVAHAAWTEALEAYEPKLCFQETTETGYIGKEEDCNNVNIWKPHEQPTGASGPELMPVMVYLHGGSFERASPNLSVYNASNLVKKSIALDKPTIVVSIQYRQGGLGFMGHSKLKAEAGSHESSGNYGLLDQIFGLQWLQQKIAAFGGDKDRITIFGESAGAYSVCTLLASPLATGLFAGAIAESAYCANSYLPAVYAEGAGAFCTKMSGCESTTTNGSTGDAELTCLRALPAKDAYGCTTTAYANAPKADGGMGAPGLLQTMPNIDGYLLRDAPLLSIQKGTCPSGKAKLPSVPVMFGSNTNELIIFAIAGAVPGLSSTSAQFPALVEASMSTAGLSLAAAAVGKTGEDVDLTPTTAATLAGMYTETDYISLTLYLEAWVASVLCPYKADSALCTTGAITNTFRRLVAEGTDQLFTSTAAALSSAMVGRDIKTFRYLFNQAATSSPLAPLGPFHSEDLAFVFDTFGHFPMGVEWNPPQELRDLSDQMQKYWINFAHYGDPNGNNNPQWDATTKDDGDQYLEIKAQTGSGGSANSKGYRLKSVNFWRSYAFKPMPIGSSNSTPSGTDTGVETDVGALVALITVTFAVFAVILACKWKRDRVEAVDAVKAIAESSASAGDVVKSGIHEHDTSKKPVHSESAGASKV